MGFFFWDMEDVLKSEAILGSAKGDPNFIPEYDINKNGTIDSFDLQWIDTAKTEHKPKLHNIALTVLILAVLGGILYTWVI